MDKIERFLSCDFVLLTRGRVDHQHLLSNMPEEILSMITIVCHPGEKELHSKTWGGKVKRITEYSGDFVGEAREWCINNLDGEYVFFLRIISNFTSVKTLILARGINMALQMLILQSLKRKPLRASIMLFYWISLIS